MGMSYTALYCLQYRFTVREFRAFFRIDVVLKRCPRGLKPLYSYEFFGTAEAVPLTKHVYTITKNALEDFARSVDATALFNTTLLTIN